MRGRVEGDTSVGQRLDVEAGRKIGQQPREADGKQEDALETPRGNTSGNHAARDTAPAGGEPRREFGNVTWSM